MNKAFVTLVGASALVVSAAGFAGGPATAPVAANNAAGFFVNGNLGYGRYGLTSSDVDAFNSVGINVDRNSFAWSINAGYQFNQYIAVEAGYMQLPYAKLTQNSTSGNVKLKTSAITADVKGILPVSQQFDLFAKAGLAFESQSLSSSNAGVTTVTTSDNHRIAPLFGLGVDYNINQNWSVGLQGIATLKTGHAANGNYYPATYTGLVGVTYKF